MTHINARDLHPYYTPEKARVRINTLDISIGTAYSKMTWFKDINGKNAGSTLRYIDVDKAISFLEEYLVTNKDKKLPTVIRGNKSKRKLLDVLKILKDK